MPPSLGWLVPSNVTSLLDQIDQQPTPGQGGGITSLLDQIDQAPVGPGPSSDDQDQHASLWAAPPQDAAEQQAISDLQAPSFTQRAAKATLGYSRAPVAMANEATGHLIRGALGIPGLVGLPDEQIRMIAREVGETTQQNTEQMTAGAPGAGHTASIVGGIAPVLIPGAGIPLVAGEMAGEKYLSMREQGASPAASRLAGAGMGAVGLALPAVGKLAAPLTEAAGAAVARSAAPLVGDAAAGVAGRIGSAAIQGEGANIALTGANAAGTALHDTDQAADELWAGLTDPTLAIVGALTHGAGELQQVARDRSQRAAIDHEQQIIDQDQARTQALQSLDPNKPQVVQREPPPQLWSDIQRQEQLRQQQVELEQAQRPDQRLADEEAAAPVESQQIAAQEAAAEQAKVQAIQQEAMAAEKAARDDTALREQAYNDLNRFRGPDDQVDRAHFGLPPEPIEPAPQPINLGRPREPAEPTPAPRPSAAEQARLANELRARQLAEQENPQEMSNAPRLREDQTQTDEGGHVGEGRQVTRGPDLQRPTEAIRATGDQPLRPQEGQAAAPQVVQGSNRPAIERLKPHAVQVNNVADLHRGLREVYGLSHDEATVATALVRAHAASKGIDPDVFTRSRISEVRRGKGNPLLNQRGQPATTLTQEMHGTRLDAPGKSLAFDHLKRQWEKAHGERLRPQTETWQQLEQRARTIDAERGNTLYQGEADPHTGLPLNEDGTVTLYHHTSKEGADAIRSTGVLRSKGEPHVYLTTERESTTGYGDHVVAIRIDPKRLVLDDEFPSGRQDFSLSVGRPGGRIRVKVEDENLYQENLKDAPAGKGSEKGAVSFAADGRAVLHALKNPDISTAVHELFHIFRRTLDGRDADIAAHWAGAKRQKDGSWSWGRAAEERLARAGERYAREGVAPTKALQGVFDKLKSWLSTIYQSIKGTPIDQQISPEMRGVFERMFTPAKGHEAAINEHNLKGPSDAAGAVPSPDRPASAPVADVRAKAIPGDSRQEEPKSAPVQGQTVDRQPSAQPAAKVEAPEEQKAAPSEPTTGNSNAMSAETRKRLGLPDRETPEGRTFDEMYEAGKKKAEMDPNAIPALVEELRRDPERVIRSDAEAGMLLKHKVDLENDLARLRKAADDAHAAGDLNGELEARTNLASQRRAMVEFTEMMERAGTAAGRALVARKMMSRMDHSLSHMEAEAAAAKGAPLTDVEAKKVDILYQSIQKANEAAQKRMQAKLDELEGKMKARDFTKPYKPPAFPRDAETLRLQAELEGAKRRYREMVREFEKANRSRLRKVGDFVGNLPGQAKSLKASLDNSAVFRQGWRVMMTNPTIWTRNALRTFVDAFKVLGGKHVMDQIHAELKASPYYEQARQAKLAIIAPEEDFPVSLPARIPGLGRVFKASEEAYTGFQYRNRMQIFERMMKVAERSGIDINDTRQLRSIGKLINSLTSRGDLGKLEPVGNILNNVFFSARKIKADFDFLTTHAADTSMTAFARKHALYNLVKVVSGTAMILAIANAAAPGSVETDPRSAAFGKIKVGNTRYDVTGGVSPMLTLAARLFTGSTKSATTGKVRNLNDGKFGSQTRADVIGSFFGNKLSPTASVVMDHLRGRTFDGKPPTMSSDAWNLLVPMAITNFLELQQDTGATPKSITAGVLADFMGIGTNTYSGTKPAAPHPSK
jgi:hypothetical protein